MQGHHRGIPNNGQTRYYKISELVGDSNHVVDGKYCLSKSEPFFAGVEHLLERYESRPRVRLIERFLLYLYFSVACRRSKTR